MAPQQLSGALLMSACAIWQVSKDVFVCRGGCEFLPCAVSVEWCLLSICCESKSPSVHARS